MVNNGDVNNCIRESDSYFLVHRCILFDVFMGHYPYCLCPPRTTMPVSKQTSVFSRTFVKL